MAVHRCPICREHCDCDDAQECDHCQTYGGFDEDTEPDIDYGDGCPD
jgi:hypothetical protein